ncbi:hypothetical protein [Roseicella aquatilis]|uniref:Calcium-binding protein n=1 Tax=Roseicella aquatilis TaxID=2527868 RepID=A0A4R4DKY7_9PROT|nr:hypothetical protein [Roseicella aquatilis]TCZ61364.1 hypothetical protein EXY23_12540 [Roseicella aquatilis]
MAQIEFEATAPGQSLDASSLMPGDYAVLRGTTGSDTLIGSAGSDRLAGRGGGDWLFGGAGNDAFFEVLDTRQVGGARDTIDGGTGTDSFNLYMGSWQMTGTVQAELQRAAGFLIASAHDADAVFVSDIFQVEMTSIEQIKVVLDGVARAISSVITQAVIDGTAGDDLLDGSGWSIPLAFRYSTGSDTMLGGSANDRFAFSGGHDSLSGGAGNDAFFSLFDPTASGARDRVDGGAGRDTLGVFINSNQVTSAVVSELRLLQQHLADHGGDGTHFTSDLLHLDITGIEAVIIKENGVNATLSDWLALH